MCESVGDLSMSSSTRTFESNRLVASDGLVQTVHGSWLTLAQSVRWLSFWAAIALPLLSLSALYLGESGLFLVLLGVQLLALRVGHDYTNTDQ